MYILTLYLCASRSANVFVISNHYNMWLYVFVVCKNYGILEFKLCRKMSFQTGVSVICKREV